MSTSRTTKILAVALAGATLVASLGEASARNRYNHGTYAYRGGYHHRGIGPGALVAGAALGVIGAATAGVAANRYYNGYPAYNYGPAYGGGYGYDYHPGFGYYGPY